MISRLFPTRSAQFLLVLSALAGAMAGVSFAMHYWLTAATFVILTVNIWMSSFLVARSYARGRFVGRLDMRMSLFEAMQRNMTFDEWFVAECERDGIPVIVQHRDE